MAKTRTRIILRDLLIYFYGEIREKTRELVSDSLRDELTKEHNRIVATLTGWIAEADAGIELNPAVISQTYHNLLRTHYALLETATGESLERELNQSLHHLYERFAQEPRDE